MNNYTDTVGGKHFTRKWLVQSLALALGFSGVLPALAAPPLVSAYDPADDATGIAIGSNLTLSFNQIVSAVAGKNLVIRKSADNSEVAKIAANDTSKVKLSGSKAVVDPGDDLVYSTGYYIQVDPGAFVNSGSEAFAGITDSTSWNFTTGSAPTAPTATAFTPSNGATDVVPGADLSLSFNECVTAVAGKNIVIKQISTNSVVETIAANDTSKVVLSCSKQSGSIFQTTNAIVNPAKDLLFSTGYFIQIDSGAFVGNVSGASYAGILDNSTWAFTTSADTIAPTVPTGLTATTVGPAQLNLQWTASTDNVGVTAYKVYRNGFLVTTRSNVTNYSDTGLTASTAYSYTVAACDVAGNCSPQSTAASKTTAAAAAATDTQAPTIPTGLTASATGASALYLSWTASTDNVGVTGYRVYRGGTPLVALSNVTSYTDTGLTAATAYNYSVAACDQAGNCSAQSSVASATTNASPTPIKSATDVIVGTNSNVSINSGGALVISATPNQSTTVVLKPDAVVNVEVKLPPGQPVIFSSNGVTQQITDVSGQSKFLTTNRGGVTQVELTKGQIQVDADKTNTTVSITSTNSQSTGALVTGADNTKVGIVKDETKASFFVDSGKVDYAAGSKPSITVYQGENSTIDLGGNLTQLALGSQNGLKQVPGDPLAVTTPKDSNTKVPNLEGTLPRFNNSVSLLDIVGDVIKAAMGDKSGQLSYDKATGVISYTLGKTTVRLIALGDVLVQLNQFAASSAAATAGGAYTLASRGIQLSLAGALGYFSDLQSVVKAADSNGQLSLKNSGAIEIRMGGGHYVAMPGVIASLPTNPNPLPGFESDASGFAVFRDRLGALQTLYPTFLEADSLVVAVAPVVPGLTLTNNGNGTVTANLGGSLMTLRPDYTIVDLPAGHDADPYWLSNGLYYFHNSDKSAQGFRVQ